MAAIDFSTKFSVEESPEKVFKAINNVGGWWAANASGNTVNLHDEFLVDFGSHWWSFQIIETVPNQKVVWKVSGSFMPWNEDQHEWTGTTISFEILPAGARTELCFTHKGLVPQFFCFQGCSKGWTGYINISLKNLITTGIGTPDFPY